MVATANAGTEQNSAGRVTESAPTAHAVSGVVRYWAAAKAASGVGEEPYRAATLAEALQAVRALHADRPRLLQILDHCSYLVDSDPVGGRDHATVRLSDGGSVEVLPPFAGG
ncbi:molybdopterin synthase sulfur carrier subunit [Kitasatospora sp. MAP5-34]|nr:molybdopterin synthase sulfur carrier subunit [Kitasatospora sp. MAP5-34]